MSAWKRGSAAPPVVPSVMMAATLLIGFARVPADTFAPGPPSGRHLTPAPGLTLPFSSQPVQGFSAVVPDLSQRGWWLALADNGYGTKANSDDFLLRVYRVRPRWGAREAQGTIEVAAGFVSLADPGHHAGFRIVNETTADRLLTGADFDPESLVVDSRGTLWIGDEFGPFLLHCSNDGVLLESPFESPGLHSPDHPRLPSAKPTAGRSRGFEGLAPRRDGHNLLAMLEAAPGADAPDTTRILEFDREQRRFTGREWRYRFDGADHSATELVPAIDPACAGDCEPFLVIERDNGHGPEARFKKVFRIEVRAPGVVGKTLVADLLNVDNPRRVGGFPATFTFPFITPEAVWQTDASTIIVVNDDNYPETGAREPGVRDDTEFIRLRIVR